MNEAVIEYFRERKIEYFCILSYSECRVIRERLVKREGFVPRSVILYLVPYNTGEAVNLSRYAVSADYHILIGQLGAGLVRLLSGMWRGSSSIAFGDHSPIDERHAAALGGVGILGDNGLLINEKYGSYVFIGEVITDIAPEQLAATAPGEIGYCSHCGACAMSCPTGKLLRNDAPCLSAVTQKKGELSREERELIKSCGTAWGCDECQRACPLNRGATTTPLDFFYRDRIVELTSSVIENMSDEELSCRAFGWRGRGTVLRNLSILEK